jgi:hypothetical protein
MPVAFLFLLTCKGLMLDISNAASTPHWPNVRYIERRACIKFFNAHCICLSRKPKQTCCGSHNKAWYSSGAMMSFLAVRISILFMCTLDLWDQLREWKAQHSRPLYWGWNVEPRWRRALVSLLAAFVEGWCILIFCSGGLAYAWQWRIG